MERTVLDDTTGDGILTGAAGRRWSAIHAAGLLSFGKMEIPVHTETAGLYRKWAMFRAGLSHDLGGLALPTEAELERLGALLVREAARSPYLRPLLHTCESHCPNDVSHCMSTRTLLPSGIPPSVPTYLEPILPLATFYGSERAAREYLLYIGREARRLEFGSQLPRCLRHAAARAAARASPETE